MGKQKHKDMLSQPVGEKAQSPEFGYGEQQLADALKLAVAALNSTLEYNQVIDAILEQVGKVVENDAANIMIIEQGSLVREVRSRGYEKYGGSANMSAAVDIATTRGLRHIRETGKLMMITNEEQAREWIYSRPEHAWIKSFIGMPIMVRGEVTGFLNVMSARPNFFTPTDAERLRAFADHAALAIQNAGLYRQVQEGMQVRQQAEVQLREYQGQLEKLVQDRTAELQKALIETSTLNGQLEREIKERMRAELELQQALVETSTLNGQLDREIRERASLEQELQRALIEASTLNGRLDREIRERKIVEDELRRLSYTDPLTGIFNRRHFFQLAERSFHEALRYHKDLSAIMVDADHFKQVNDVYGHAIGDKVLIGLATYLNENLRQVDIVGRYGGEEFVVIMPETGLATAIQAAERLLAGIRAIETETPRGILKITASLGVAVLDAGSDESVYALVDRADQAMYAAKRSGRAKVVTSVPGEERL